MNKLTVLFYVFYSKLNFLKMIMSINADSCNMTLIILADTISRLIISAFYMSFLFQQYNFLNDFRENLSEYERQSEDRSVSRWQVYSFHKQFNIKMLFNCIWSNYFFKFLLIWSLKLGFSLYESYFPIFFLYETWYCSM